ncbi:tetratricopeptide repeat-containing sensor histidine kinase [Aquimarina algicola]|uniref:histidine kinase n=1 Tax=Aquimarina algicola TaxID=2589995 RepID=A0A504JQ87_9FLAO|nr:ATP-binding protein [Aquimarina algicola]TPN88951.1 hypothetical protein FHK87_01665 [Aquimarina algicola]
MILKRCLVFLIYQLFAGFISLSFGQNIDQIKLQLVDAHHDTTRVKLMCELSRAYEGIDSVNAFKHSKAALKLSKNIDYQYGVALSYHTLAVEYSSYFDAERAKKNYHIANEYIEQLLKKDSSRQNLKLWAKNNFNLGVAYGYEGNNEKEISYIEKTIPIARKIRDTLFLGIAYTNLGIKHMNFGKNTRAYYYFNQSDYYYKLKDLPEDIIFDRLCFSLCLYQLDSLPAMKKALDEVKFNLDRVPESKYRHKYYSHRGLYYSGIGDYKEAIKMYDKAYDFIKKHKIHREYSPLYMIYAETYEQLKNYKMSKKYMLDFLEESLKSGNDVSRSKAYYRLGVYEAKQKNYDKAYEYAQKHIDLLDSLDYKQTAQKIDQLEIQYQSEKKEKEILKLTNERNEVALVLEKKRSQGYLMAILIITLCSALIIIFFIYRNQIKSNHIKERKHQEEIGTLKHQQQTKVFSAMIEGQEKERKRLAIDLHDGLGGRLSAISLKLSKLDNNRYTEYPKQELNIIQNDITNSLIELRGVARNLMPETLLKYGLQSALKDYCSNMNNEDNQITLQFYGSYKNVSTSDQVTLYRIIQELINNAIKHAKASEILVQYIQEDNKIDITVEDNGIGFDMTSLDQTKGMGLNNLKTRVEYLDGYFDIQSKQDEGTTVTIQINI